MASKIIVTRKYDREFETPLVAPKGTVLEVLGRNEGTYTHWFICRSENGIKAYVPEEWLEIKDNRGTLKADYNSWELSVKVGEKLTRILESGGWIWAKNSDDEYGWVPEINTKSIEK